MSDLNFQHKNITGKIKFAKIVNLTNAQTYDLETKPDIRTGKYSVCLFTDIDKKIPITSEKGNTYFLVFRLDFNDMGKGKDPTLDLDLFNEKEKIHIGKQRIHRTKKQLSDDLWKYVVNGSLVVAGDVIPLSFEFQVTTTIAHEVFARANIAKGKINR